MDIRLSSYPETFKLFPCVSGLVKGSDIIVLTAYDADSWVGKLRETPDLIEQIITHETIHYILNRDLGFDVSNKFDNLGKYFKRMDLMDIYANRDIRR